MTPKPGNISNPQPRHQTKEPTPSPPLNPILIITTIITTIIGIVVFFILQSSYNDAILYFDAENIVTNIRTTRIHKEQWEVDKPINLLTPPQHLTTLSTSPIPTRNELIYDPSLIPRVFTNTFVTQWPAFINADTKQKWDLFAQEWWESFFPTHLLRVGQSSSSHFGPTTISTPAKTSYNGQKQQFQHRNGEIIQTRPYLRNDFFTTILHKTEQTKKDFLSYSTQVPHTKLHTISPHNELLPGKSLSKGQKSSHINIVIDAKDVTHQLESHHEEIFIVQISGSQHFTIISPDYSDQLFLYPLHHPAHGQAQVYLNTTEARSNLAMMINHEINHGIYSVTLHPGDVLHVPPYWLYQTNALKPTMSLVFSSHSRDHALFAKAIEITANNLLHEFTTPQRRLVTAVLINLILSHHDMRYMMKVYDNEIDIDPFGLKSKFKNMYHTAVNTAKSNNKDNGETTDSINELQWEAFVMENTPLGKGKLLHDDDYVKLFFQRYVDSRYQHGFDQGIYTLFPSLQSSMQGKSDIIETKSTEQKNDPISSTNTIKSHNTDTISAPNTLTDPIPSQSFLLQHCSLATDLFIPSMTAEAYFRIYQGGGLLATPRYREQLAQFEIDQAIPNDIYIRLLFDIAQMIVQELKHVNPTVRPILFANMIESWAQWSINDNLGVIETKREENLTKDWDKDDIETENSADSNVDRDVNPRVKNGADNNDDKNSKSKNKTKSGKNNQKAKLGDIVSKLNKNKARDTTSTVMHHHEELPTLLYCFKHITVNLA